MNETYVDIEVSARIRAEYREMPGMRLTREQAARLFNVELRRCGRILDWLVRSGILWTNGREFFAANVGRRCA